MKRLALASILLTLLGLLFAPKFVKADLDDFVIHSFKADYVIDNDKTGGTLDTLETINLTFSDNNHGILRAVPGSYQGYNTKLNVLSIERDGAKEPYTTYKDSGNIVLKIGDSGKTITGRHTYRIHYSQERIINFKGQKPTFYWDVNGTEWKQPFERVEARLTIKGAAANSRPRAGNSTCFAGYQLSQTKDCIIFDDANTVVFQTTRTLAPGENMSIEVPMDNILFSAPTIKDKITDNIGSLIGLAAGLLLGFIALVWWWRNGKDYRGKGVIVPEYDPPKQLTPGEVGMLADYNVDGRDISATLIDLAVRGHVKLYEDVKKVLFVKRRSYKLELLNPDFSKLKKHEKALLEAIFPKKEKGEIVEMNKLNKTAMSSAIQSIRKDLKSYLTDSYGFFEKKAESQKTIMIVIGSALFFAVFFIHPNIGTIIGMVIAAASFFGLGLLMSRRSHAGVETYEKIKGLELYLKTAEADRLKMMQSVDRPYAEPKRSVELFEKLLSFAVALGVEKSWAKQFDGILKESPSWYSGSSVNSFNATALASGLGSATSSFSQSFESSSGSSGGSGGGGGGGGGGGW